ncbi:MAG: hypothetical protein K2K63_15175 [Acetatifactor sp.]|nr:hypothetical protein [Acetatifactor sp.]
MVKTERLKLVIEILTSQMNHWIFFTLVMAVRGISMGFMGNSTGDEPDFLLWAVCGLVPIAFFLVRCYAERLWLFVLYHGAVLAVLSAAALLYRNGTVICAVCAVVYTICSFKMRLGENNAVYSEGIHPLAAVGLSAAANFLFHIEDGMPDWDRYYLFILIGVLACYMIIYYLKHYLNFLRLNESSAGYLPAGEMLSAGMGLILPYTLFGVMILLLSLNVDWLEPIFRVLTKGLKEVLKFIFRLLSVSDAAEEPISVEKSISYSPEAEILSPPEAENFWLWEVLEYAVLILFACGCVFALIKGLRWLVRYLREHFGRNAAGENIITGREDVLDVREKCSIEKSGSGSKSLSLFRIFTPVERVRRLYKKRVLSGKDGIKDRGTLKVMTARECGEALSLPNMARLYEQARYSDKEITSEDVRRMKLACGGQVTSN